MKLTTNFSLGEFTRSATAVKCGIKNEPDGLQLSSLKQLCTALLQPLRNLYGRPFHINSGFRCPELNKAVGGAPSSQHLKGQAADVSAGDPRNLLDELLRSGLDFDQAILYPTFLHLSYNAAGNRKQVLYAKGVKP